MATALAAPPITRRAAFGGYALVGVAAGWMAGIALRDASPLVALPPLAWLAFLPPAVLLAVTAALAYRKSAANQGLRIALIAGVILVAVALGGWRAALADARFAPDSIALLARNQSVALQGSVSGEPDIRGGYRYLTVDVASVSVNGGKTWQQATGSVSATVYGVDDWFAPAYGDTVRLSGTLRPPGAGYMPPGTVARLTGARATIEARGGNPVLAALFAVRVRLAQVIQRSLPEPEAALLIGILLGLKTPTLRARLPLFTTTGTIHLVVPAGLKVATVAELATLSARPLGRLPQALLGLLAVTAYASIGGGGAAAIRAAIMGILLALAPLLGRAYNVFTALSLAALGMTALEPSLVSDAGFQLTVLATAGLPLLVVPIQMWLMRWLRWMPAAGLVTNLLATTLAAQVATLPVLVLTFHQLSLIAPIANLLTVPLLAPLLVLGLLVAAAGLAGLGFVTLALVWFTWPLLWFADGAIALFAALPFASLTITSLPLIAPLTYYAALALCVFWLLPRLRARKHGHIVVSHAAGGGHVRLPLRVVMGMLVVALLVSTGAASPVLARGTTHLEFLDTGSTGMAALLRLPSGATVLIDGGADGPAIETLLAGRLPFWQRTIDLALLTDALPQDARGLEDVVAHFHVARAADGGMLHPSTEYLAWLDAARRAGAEHVLIRQGDSVSVGRELSLHVLSPPQELFPEGGGSSTASDDAIFRLDLDGLRALLLGGADSYALDALAYSGQSLAADVVQVTLPSDEPLSLAGPLGVVLRAAHPRVIVVSPAPPSSKHGGALSPSSIEAEDMVAAAALGAVNVYRTSLVGSVSLVGGAQGWSLG